MIDIQMTAMYQRITRALVLAILVSCGGMLVGILISLAVSSAAALPRLVYGSLIVVAIGGALLTLHWLPRRPLWHATTFFGTLLCMLIVLASAVLPEFVLITTPFFALVLLLISFGGRPVLTRVFFGVALLLTLVLPLRLTDQIAWLVPLQVSLGDLTRIVAIVSLVIFITAIYQIARTLFAAQQAALTLAADQLATADAARATAEQSQQDIAAQSAEQARLLGLIATLEVPIITLAPGLLFAPLMGSLDQQRLGTLSIRMLHAVADQRADRIILDITGVALADMAVLPTLHDLIASIQLIGCAVSLTGVSAALAGALAQHEYAFTGVDIAARPYDVLLPYLRHQDRLRS